MSILVLPRDLKTNKQINKKNCDMYGAYLKKTTSLVSELYDLSLYFLEAGKYIGWNCIYFFLPGALQPQGNSV